MRRSHGWTPRSLRRHYPHQVQGVVPLPDLSAIRLPRSIYFRIRLARCKSMPRRIVAAFVSNAEPSRGAWHKRLYNYGSPLLAPHSFPYLSAAACFTLVWKIACHPPFAIFQTDPALKVPEASFPSLLPSTT